VFDKLESINARPRPFEFYTARELWTNQHTSERMLAFHLHENIDVSSRRLDFINRSVDWITVHFNIGADTRIVDFGCGPGLYTERFAQRQARVTGVDFSKRSIEYAQEVADRKGLDIHYVNQDYLEFETTDSFDLILMIMCDFCALSPTQRKAMLGKFLRMLEPGGAVLLDVYSTTAFDECEETAKYEVSLLDGFWSPDKYYGFLNTFKYEQERVVLDKYTVVERSGTRTVYNWLQYFSADELEREFVDAGFAVEAFYADVAGAAFEKDGTEFAVVARKAAA
jgi:cyclopropane fatty-acyl-phospholipid synthase-like methyltransferase